MQYLAACKASLSPQVDACWLICLPKRSVFFFFSFFLFFFFSFFLFFFFSFFLFSSFEMFVRFFNFSGEQKMLFTLYEPRWTYLYTQFP